MTDALVRGGGGGGYRITPCCRVGGCLISPKQNLDFRWIAADLPTGDGRATAEGMGVQPAIPAMNVAASLSNVS